jgi:hypothetical protein
VLRIAFGEPETIELAETSLVAKHHTIRHIDIVANVIGIGDRAFENWSAVTILTIGLG